MRLPATPRCYARLAARSGPGELAQGREGHGIAERGPEADRVVPRAVAVRAAGGDQAETVRELPPVLALHEVVIGVVDLEPRHPRPRHRLDEHLGDRALVSPHPRVREHAEPSRAPDQGEGVERIESVLRHVRRLPVADPPVEGVLLGLDVAGLDHGLRDVGTDDVPAPRDLVDPLELDLQTELPELVDHPLPTAEPLIAEAAQLLLERGVRDVHPVTQDVDARAFVLGGELDARHDLDPEIDAGRQRLLEPLGRVVIGHRDHVEPAFGGQPDEPGGREGPIRAIGVRVQVDPGHGPDGLRPGGRSPTSYRAPHRGPPTGPVEQPERPLVRPSSPCYTGAQPAGHRCHLDAPGDACRRRLGPMKRTLVSIALAAISAALLPATASAASTWVVDDDGSATTIACDAETAADSSTIGGAVAPATAGDTIQVCPGTYAELVVVNKALTLLGN